MEAIYNTVLKLDFIRLSLRYAGDIDINVLKRKRTIDFYIQQVTEVLLKHCTSIYERLIDEQTLQSH